MTIKSVVFYNAEASDDFLTWTLESPDPLAIGQRVKANEETVGLVIQLQPITIFFTQPVPLLEQLRPMDWWRASHPKTAVIDPRTFERDDTSLLLLQVPCIVPEIHLPGTLGWTLIWNGGSVLEGNDYFTPRQCLYQGKGRWRPGEYTLLIRRFHPRGGWARSEASVDWTLSGLSAALIWEKTPPDLR